MAKDCAANNEQLIAGIIKREIERSNLSSTVRETDEKKRPNSPNSLCGTDPRAGQNVGPVEEFNRKYKNYGIKVKNPDSQALEAMASIAYSTGAIDLANRLRNLIN